MSIKPNLLFFQTYWGSPLSWDAFCKKSKLAGYDGVEIWFPFEQVADIEIQARLQEYDLKLVLGFGTDKSIPYKESLIEYINQLKKLCRFKPTAINAHTGSDFFTQAQNKAFIDAANKISKEKNIPVYHETHRGRFAFNLPDTNRFLELIPDLKLNLDISHWIVVHESLLEDQDKNLELVIDRTNHIHARIGFEEGPQVNNPEAPEWNRELKRHLDIWEKVILKRWEEGHEIFTVTTEFGPPNYLHTLPFSQIPVSDQWEANIFIMDALKKRLRL